MYSAYTIVLEYIMTYLLQMLLLLVCQDKYIIENGIQFHVSHTNKTVELLGISSEFNF